MPAVLSSATTGKLPTNSKNAKMLSSTIESGNAPPTSRFTRKRVVDELKEQSQYPTSRSTNGNGDTMTAFDFCQSLLIAGFVQSYVDFYNLTHRADPNAREQSESGEQIVVSVDDMLFIRDSLTTAERAKRQGDTLHVYTSYTKLAEHYARLSDYTTAVFFYEKCLDIATLTSDINAEMTANHSLGTVYQNFGGKDDMARRCHERHNELAESVDAADEIIKANVELYRVYSSLADTQLAEGRPEAALKLYNYALTAATKSWSKSAEAEANGKLGTLLLQRGDAAGAVPFLRKQSQISADTGDAESRCRACSSLALAYDKLGKMDQALAELSLVGTISEQAGDEMLEAQACRALGTLYSKVGKLAEAMEALQRYFGLLKAILSKQAKDAAALQSAVAAPASRSGAPPITLRDIELARAYVGVARGNLMMGSYIVAIQNDFNSVLGWKLNRAVITPPSPPQSAEEKAEAAEEKGADVEGEPAVEGEAKEAATAVVAEGVSH